MAMSMCTYGMSVCTCTAMSVHVRVDVLMSASLHTRATRTRQAVGRAEDAARLVGTLREALGSHRAVQSGAMSTGGRSKKVRLASVGWACSSAPSAGPSVSSPSGSGSAAKVSTCPFSIRCNIVAS